VGEEEQGVEPALAQGPGRGVMHVQVHEAREDECPGVGAALAAAVANRCDAVAGQCQRLPRTAAAARLHQGDVVQHQAGVRHGEPRRPQPPRQDPDAERGPQTQPERDSQHLWQL
jgi:hypothetical protein